LLLRTFSESFILKINFSCQRIKSYDSCSRAINESSLYLFFLICAFYSFIAVFCLLTTYINEVKRKKQTHTYFPLIVSVIINTEHPGRGFGIALRYKLNPAFAPHRGEERGQFVSSVSAFALRPFYRLIMKKRKKFIFLFFFHVNSARDFI